MTYQSRRLRILPADNAAMPVQYCERLSVRLSIAACGTRWLKAEAQRLQQRKSSERNPYTTQLVEQYISCAGCPVGEANQALLAAASSESGDDPARKQSRAHPRGGSQNESTARVRVKKPSRERAAVDRKLSKVRTQTSCSSRSLGEADES